MCLILMPTVPSLHRYTNCTRVAMHMNISLCCISVTNRWLAKYVFKCPKRYVKYEHNPWHLLHMKSSGKIVEMHPGTQTIPSASGSLQAVQCLRMKFSLWHSFHYVIYITLVSWSFYASLIYLMTNFCLNKWICCISLIKSRPPRTIFPVTINEINKSDLSQSCALPREGKVTMDSVQAVLYLCLTC